VNQEAPATFEIYLYSYPGVDFFVKRGVVKTIESKLDISSSVSYQTSSVSGTSRTVDTPVTSISTTRWKNIWYENADGKDINTNISDDFPVLPGHEILLVYVGSSSGDTGNLCGYYNFATGKRLLVPSNSKVTTYNRKFLEEQIDTIINTYAENRESDEKAIEQKEIWLRSRFVEHRKNRRWWMGVSLAIVVAILTLIWPPLALIFGVILFFWLLIAWILKQS
jgi:hypothetical protein